MVFALRPPEPPLYLRMSNLWAPGRVPVEAISTRMALRQLLLGRLGMVNLTLAKGVPLFESEVMQRWHRISYQKM